MAMARVKVVAAVVEEQHWTVKMVGVAAGLQEGRVEH